jgi:hypothetical protein
MVGAGDGHENDPKPEPEPCTSISFRDPDLEREVRYELQIPSGEIDPEVAASRTWLSIMSFQSLEGLECFPSLLRLDVWSSPRVTDLSRFQGYSC